ncbi:MAG: type II toxin-antitoxin system RelE/ParE family toxin [Treponema sp.]|nr:type II toxin-antitoxin system RelE/ParE family toxin [Treponema sp.]
MAEANLGSGVYKARFARPGEGKSGGYRIILFDLEVKFQSMFFRIINISGRKHAPGNASVDFTGFLQIPHQTFTHVLYPC